MLSPSTSTTAGVAKPFGVATAPACVVILRITLPVWMSTIYNAAYPVVLAWPSLWVLTGCEFPAAQELLVLATGEGNSSMRERWGQKKAEDSGAPSDTKRR